MTMSVPTGGLRARLFGLFMIFAGIAGWFYNHHLAATEGEFYIRLCVFSPLGVFRLDIPDSVTARLDRPHPTQQFARPKNVALGRHWDYSGDKVSGIDMFSLTSAHTPKRFERPRGPTGRPTSELQHVGQSPHVASAGL